MLGVRRSAPAGGVVRVSGVPAAPERDGGGGGGGGARGGGSLLEIMRGLWPYIWPADRRDLKLRVAVAMLPLLAAKLATIAVPFTFKWATDALTGEGTRRRAVGRGSSGSSPRRSL